MLLCKNCINNKIHDWKKPFNLEVSDHEHIPEYYEVMQHVWDFDPAVIGTKLENGEMLEIMCASCKMTHIGKDQNGDLKVRYAGDPVGEWKDYV